MAIDRALWQCQQLLEGVEDDDRFNWVLSARIGGSRARAVADSLSDIDVFFVVRQEYFVLNSVLRLVELFGPYSVRDIPRSSETWGFWVTGLFDRYGFVDVMIKSES